MLEDDSGRILLVGDLLKSVNLVTGCIIAVMGTENVNGELEVIDIKFPDLSPQPKRWTLSKPVSTSSSSSTGTGTGTGFSKLRNEIKTTDDEMTDAKPGNKIAIVSGLAFSGTDTSYSMELNLLLEYLVGEALDPTSQEAVSHISRLIVAGNSISTDDRRLTADEDAEKKTHKK